MANPRSCWKLLAAVAVVAASAGSCSSPSPSTSGDAGGLGSTSSRSPASLSSSGDSTNALVTRAVDGDTIEVRFRGEDRTVRLIGIDTPESVAPGVPVQCYALAVSHFTERELVGERVRLEFDVERIDRYGRTLAYVWRGGELFNETLVRDGYAFVTTYPPDVKYESRFVAAQREARTDGRGVWGKCVTPDPVGSCDPAYPGVCIPPPPPDLDCSDINERHFTVLPPDPHHFDLDGNGIGCESV